MAVKPPLDLAVEITAADGSSYRWGPESQAGSIPQNLSFRTKRGEGFSDSNLTLARRIDRDYVDINLLDNVVIHGAEGSIAYEGRVQGVPRSLSSTHSLTIQAVGWMAHTRDRKMSEIYVDRDLSRWGVASTQLQINQYTFANVGDAPTVAPDPSGFTALQQTLVGAWPANNRHLGWYDAGPGNLLGALYYSWKVNGNVSAGDANWAIYAHLSSDDLETSRDSTGNLHSGTSGSGYLTATTAKRYAEVQFWYNAAAGTDKTEYSLFWQLAAYGNHGLTRQGTNPGGILASDAVKHLIGKYCPRLSTTGVQSTTYPIPHLAFRDRIDPYDALMEINKYHLWQLGVYENQTLYFNPVDMSDYDWEVRLSDPGVAVDLQGDSVDQLANGIVVTYTDVATGTTAVITPLTDTTLADTSVDNPVNTHGLTRWTEISLSTPTTATAAAQIGRAALAEFNQPKGPGTVTVQGHIRDRQGHWQPVWKVRAGDRIAITDHPNDRARLVAETDYQHSGRTIQIAVDSTFKRLDAILDRLGTAITAANLS